MLATEMIKQLQELVAINGDHDVIVWDIDPESSDYYIVDTVSMNYDGKSIVIDIDCVY